MRQLFFSMQNHAPFELQKSVLIYKLVTLKVTLKLCTCAPLRDILPCRNLINHSQIAFRKPDK
jgi:hypothetical protein